MTTDENQRILDLAADVGRMSAQAIEDAYKEGWQDYHEEITSGWEPKPTPGWVTERYNESRAKMLADGLIEQLTKRGLKP